MSDCVARPRSHPDRRTSSCEGLSVDEQHVAVGVRGHGFVDMPPKQSVDEAMLPAPDHDQVRLAFPRESKQPLRGIADLGHILGLDSAWRECHPCPL